MSHEEILELFGLEDATPQIIGGTMKTILITLTLLIAQVGQATYQPDGARKYQFSFPYKNEVFRTEKVASSYEIAFQTAAQECFNYFKSGKKLTEEQGLDIIDVCANPRS